MHRLTACLTVSALVTACIHIPISTTTHELGAAAPELRGHGVAEVAALAHEEATAPSATIERIHIDDKVEARFATRAFDPAHRPGDLVLSETTEVRIHELFAGCPEGTIIVDDETRRSYPDCKLFRANDYIELGHHTRIDDSVIIGSAALAGVGGLVACTFECSSGLRYTSGAVLVGIGVIAVAAGIWVYAVVKQH